MDDDVPYRVIKEYYCEVVNDKCIQEIFRSGEIPDKRPNCSMCELFSSCLICDESLDYDSLLEVIACSNDDRDDPFVSFAGFPVGHKSEFQRILVKCMK